MSRKNRNLFFFKLHQQLEPGHVSTVPPDSSITFTVPYGALGSGIESQNRLGIPSIYHNPESKPEAVVEALSKKRPRDQVLTLLKRNTGIRPVVYEAGNTIPASWVFNNNERITFHSSTPFQPKTTRSGVVFNRGRIPKKPTVLVNLVNRKRGNYIVHACRFVNLQNRGRCVHQLQHLTDELKRKYKNKRNTLRGNKNRQGNWQGNAVPLEINSNRKSLRLKKQNGHTGQSK
jgi:hypothetical protein